MATLFHSGTIWAGRRHGEHDALLIGDGRVLALGDAARAHPEAAGAERVDLGGAFLMPSFGDGHAHPMFGGLEQQGPAVRACGSVEEIVAEVRRYAQAHPELPWIFGASYDGSLAEEGLFDARWLDEAVPDRPVVLRAWDYHTVWVNSAALRAAGITAETPEPELGEIPRRPDGSPLGTLREWGAVDLVMDVAPRRSAAERLGAVRAMGEYYLARGVSWVQDAWVEPETLDSYLEAAAADALPLRVNLAHYADPRRFEEQLPRFRADRARVEAAGHRLLTAHTVKFFADGVVENETGALLEPYCSALHKHGMSVWPGRRLAEAAAAVDAAGFQIHIHAIGDAAVRQALDAIEYAAQRNGPRDRRPVVAHAQLIDPADLPRFARLGVVACAQPLWAQLDALMTVLTVPRLGPERSDRQYPLRSLLDDGATLSFGSDWPVSSGDPRKGLAIAMSRTTVEGEPAGGWTPHEIVPAEAALDAYTRAVAHQAFADAGPEPWGELVPGVSADLVVLEHDPRAQEPHALRRNPVLGTWLRGERAWRR
ncbi:MAG: amidohydrolase [Pseudoclavibacter sp.]|nr:amidohydrolase [Pseudoclavibacter sp.]